MQMLAGKGLLFCTTASEIFFFFLFLFTMGKNIWLVLKIKVLLNCTLLLIVQLQKWNKDLTAPAKEPGLCECLFFVSLTNFHRMQF